MEYDSNLYNNHGGIKLRITNQSDSQVIEKQYPYVISTLPSGAYLNGDLKDNLTNDSFLCESAGYPGSQLYVRF